MSALSKVQKAQHLLKQGAVAAAVGVLAMAAHAADAPPASLEQIQSVKISASAPIDALKEERDLRMKAMRESAQSYGARAGLLRRTHEIRATLESSARHLDTIWNFTPLMLLDKQPGEQADGRARLIVPPVIVQANTGFKQESGTIIRTFDKSYKILQNARFSPVALNWRQYLLRNLGESEVNPPHFSLMPRTAEEKKQWDGWVKDGWTAGIAQAESIFETDLNRLARDIDGMVTYHEMVMKKMVSLPFVATANLGVTGDDTTMNINDVQLRITVLPAFNRDHSQWKPLTE